MLVHQCDCCHKPIENDNYNTFILPKNKYTYIIDKGVIIQKFQNVGIDIKMVEFCPKCTRMLADLLETILED